MPMKKPPGPQRSREGTLLDSTCWLHLCNADSPCFFIPFLDWLAVNNRGGIAISLREWHAVLLLGGGWACFLVTHAALIRRFRAA